MTDVGPRLDYLELKRRPCPEVSTFVVGRETKLLVGRETKLLVGRETKLVAGRESKLFVGRETKLLVGRETKLLVGRETTFWEGVFLDRHSRGKVPGGLVK